MDTIDYLAFIAKELQSTIEDYNTLQIKFNTNLKNIIKNIEHMHAVHAHPCCHTYIGETDSRNYNDIYFKKCNTNCYETKFYPDISATPVNILMREVSLKVDCDNNGKIFTEDFLFDIKDTSVPKILVSMQRLKFNRINVPMYSWNTYLTTVSQYAFI